jgi:hypothetical protein
MHKGVHLTNGGGGGGDSRLRRHEKRQHFFKEKGLDLSHFLADPSPSSPDQVYTYAYNLFVYSVAFSFL